MARPFFIIIGYLFISMVFIQAADAQQVRNYELLPAPDLWYNDVDGIRAGLRLKGQVPGTFEDGPHRLDAGIWLGFWFPEDPVSYYVSFTEPIPAWSGFGSEASVEAISSIRTGYSIHGIAFNKRWQNGFDERKFRELRLFNSFETRFDTEYTPFPALWGDFFEQGSDFEPSNDKLLTTLTTQIQDENRLGQYSILFEGVVQYREDSYGVASLTTHQMIPFKENWTLRFRGFAGVASESAQPEYLFSRSTGQPITTLQSGVTRAKGTIPQPWITSGNFQVAGGANLRGYTADDIKLFDQASCSGCESLVLPSRPPGLFRSIAALNSELDYPNPIQSLFSDLPYASDFLDFRTYLFFDAGSPLGLDDEMTTLFADAGTGFSLSLNIPDSLGKNRGFVFRYDIPFWLSEPGTDDAWKYRSVFAFGAVLSF